MICRGCRDFSVAQAFTPGTIVVDVTFDSKPLLGAVDAVVSEAPYGAQNRLFYASTGPKARTPGLEKTGADHTFRDGGSVNYCR